MYPCRAEPGDLQSRAVAAGPARVTEFPSLAFDNPQHSKIKANPRKKRNNPPLLPEALGRGMGSNAESRRLALGGAEGAASAGAPGPTQAGPALTKQLSMEQETRAVRLMVAGGLGQRTCPRSLCAARQPRALPASRLRGPPGTAAATRRQARWRRVLGATPACLSPPLHNGASPAPPFGTSAKGRGTKRGERPKTRGEGGGGSRGPAHSHRLLPPRSLTAAWEGVLRGRLGAFGRLRCRTVPRPREKGRQDAYIFSFPIFPGEQPHIPLFTNPALRSTPPPTSEFLRCQFLIPKMKLTYLHLMPFPV